MVLKSSLSFTFELLELAFFVMASKPAGHEVQFLKHIRTFTISTKEITKSSKLLYVRDLRYPSQTFEFYSHC